MEVSVHDLKNHLSEYLRRARAGEEIVVTSRGKPVCRLIGPHPRDDESEVNAVARLRAQPWLSPGNGKPVAGSTSPATLSMGTTEELIHWVRDS